MTATNGRDNQAVTYLPPLHAAKGGLHSISLGTISLAVDPDHRVSGLDMVQTLLTAGWHDEARLLLRQLTVLTPSAVEPWLQLLALDPTAIQDRALLQAFAEHHPRHPVAQALAMHLQKGTPLDSYPLSIIAPPAVSHAGHPARVGDYLIQAGWTTSQRVTDALNEQQRLRQVKINERLGTVMLMRDDVTPEQLALALRPGLAVNNGELGNYLVRARILPASQVAKALARQTSIAATHDVTYLDALKAYEGRGVSRYIRRWQGPPTRQMAPKIGEVLVDMRLLSRDQITTVLRERAYAAGHSQRVAGRADTSG